uniref:Galectin domain-containing protein n=1 Tax=Hucho hucho TaxID=62062 RepID=A0A4W5KL40_9TELE
MVLSLYKTSHPAASVSCSRTRLSSISPSTRLSVCLSVDLLVTVIMFVAPPGYQPIYNPSIPYVGPIYGGLRSGMSIYIHGVIPHEITR